MSFVQAAVSADPSVAATTVSVTISAGGTGNHIMGMVSCQASGVTLSSVKDNNGVSYTVQDNINDVANATEGWSFFKENISGAPTSIVATFTTSQLARIQVVEWSGLAASASLDGHSAANPTAANPQAGSFTTTANGDLIYAAITCSSVGGTTPTAGTQITFTKRNAGTGTEIGVDETGIQTTAGAINPDFTNVSATWLVFALAFKAAAATSLPPGAQSFSTPQPDRDTALFPAQLRTWIAPDRMILIGQDSFPPGKQNYQRPPDPQDPFAQWRTWTQTRNPNLNGLDAFPPGRQTNYLPDRIAWLPASPPQNLANTLLAPLPPAVLPPGAQLYARWSDPQDGFSQWRTWTQTRNPNLAAQDVLPPGKQSYALPPYGAPPPVPAWSSFNINLTPPPVPPTSRAVFATYFGGQGMGFMTVNPGEIPS